LVDSAPVVANVTVIPVNDAPLAFVDINVLDADLPVIFASVDVEVNANALSTKVELGVATAQDSLGSSIPVSLDGGTTFFKSGVNSVFWRATDSLGRTAL
jgi:hypothetical protein